MFQRKVRRDLRRSADRSAPDLRNEFKKTDNRRYMGFLPARYILEITVFVCGALVMIYEIIGSRIVSPFIGTSTYVWTSLIGVILASLSLGYWIGGRVADRRPDPKLLAMVIFAAGGAVSLTILVRDLVLTGVAAAPTGLEIKSVLASILLFAPASVALGFVPPYAVKLKMISLDDTGKTVGRMYALSTVGSIVGTFAAGFLLIPFVGSVRSLYIVAAVLFALALLIAPLAFTRASFSAVVLFLLAIAGSEASIYHLQRTSELIDIDTEYSRVQIFRTTDPKTGRPMRAMATDPHYVQSAMYLDGDDLALRYTPFYHLVRHFRPDFRTALMIGGAGYTFPQEYLRKYTDATIDVVEIDPRMTEIAREHFRLREDPRLNVFHEDGRVFLNRAGSATYDAVFIDAFGSLFTVPYQLTTIEAVRHVRRVLDDRGVVIFNIGAAIRGRSSGFLQAEIATYQAVFERVYLFKVNLETADERTQNIIIVACRSECSTDDRGGDADISRLLLHRYTGNIPLDMPVLTDDLAPVEYYNSFGQNAPR
jgi:spermidine synthase